MGDASGKMRLGLSWKQQWEEGLGGEHPETALGCRVGATATFRVTNAL